MSWENHGEWHMDHIMPCATFDLSKEEELKKCFHYTNFQPLWAKENLAKGSKIYDYTDEYEELEENETETIEEFKELIKESIDDEL